jgi:hypothetical protein
MKKVLKSPFVSGGNYENEYYEDGDSECGESKYKNISDCKILVKPLGAMLVAICVIAFILAFIIFYSDTEITSVQMKSLGIIMVDALIKVMLFFGDPACSSAINIFILFFVCISSLVLSWLHKRYPLKLNTSQKWAFSLATVNFFLVMVLGLTLNGCGGGGIGIFGALVAGITGVIVCKGTSSVLSLF